MRAAGDCRSCATKIIGAEIGQERFNDIGDLLAQSGTKVVQLEAGPFRGGTGQLTVEAGQGVHTRPGEWVRYSTPGADGAEYIAVCLPAFAPDTVHRDD